MDIDKIMVKGVRTIGPDATIQEAAGAMSKSGIGSLVVISNNNMVGIVTERDIMNFVASGKDIDGVRVKEIMTKKVIFVSPQTDIYDAAEVMLKNKIKKLPVISGDALIGIVTATDLIAAEPKLLDALGKLMLFKRKHYLAG